MEVTRTLVLQGILPINKDNKLNEKVPLASYHTEVTAELRNWRALRVSYSKCILIIGERERANLVVRLARFFYIIIGERERANLVVRLATIFLYMGRRTF